jgi:uncharacterized Zn-binding protein involved in type VI secretion
MGKPAARLGDMTAHGGSIVVGFPMVMIGGQPAARIGDMHVCPLPNPGLPPPPHVGGPVVLGAPTVLVGGTPVARMGDMVTCAGPPDTVMGGCPTVLIGEAGSGAGAGAGAGGGSGDDQEGPGKDGGRGKGALARALRAQQAKSAAFKFETDTSSAGSAFGMKMSTMGGEPSEEPAAGHWVEFQFVDKAGLPVGGPHFEFEANDGAKERGVVQSDGLVRREGIPSGNCTVRLFSLSDAAWSKDEARTGDTVTLSAKVDGFADGVAAKITIKERDLSGADKAVETLDAKVKGGKVEIDWDYPSQDADEPSSGSSAPAGFSRPEYFFTVEVQDCTTTSGMLFFKDWLEIDLKDAQDQPMANQEYRLVLPSGEVRKGALDRNGHARIEDVPPGRARVEIARFPHAQLETG